LTSAAVLDRGWQKVGWESGRKRGDDEGEEAEDAERVRPGCGGDGEEADPGHEASDRELTPDEVAAIDALDTGVRGGPDPELVDTKHYPFKVEN
jgi:hypothetical protein